MIGSIFNRKKRLDKKDRNDKALLKRLQDITRQKPKLQENEATDFSDLIEKGDIHGAD